MATPPEGLGIRQRKAGFVVSEDETGERRGSSVNDGSYLISRVLGALSLSCFLAAALYPTQWQTPPSELRAGAQLVAEVQSKYQRIVVTRFQRDTRLFLDGMLQFSSVDEHRYHEVLVHPALLAVRKLGGNPKRVLVLGGGDGMAVREILKYAEVEEVLVIDLDAAVTRLFTRDGDDSGNGGTEVGGGTDVDLPDLNGNAFSDERVRVVNDDALAFVRRADAHTWDAIIMDLPDPNSELLAGLFTLEVFRSTLRLLRPVHGVLVTQATSPFAHSSAFWCIFDTLRAAAAAAAPPTSAGTVRPLKVTVPSFGVWGFALWTPRRLELQELALAPSVPLQFLTPQILRVLHIFGLDEGERHKHAEGTSASINTDQHLIVHELFRTANFELGLEY